jgi:AraC family transcriptional regulator of adaptative response/methylated-DNA-[protein]-cysteine methyltransferase
MYKRHDYNRKQHLQTAKDLAGLEDPQGLIEEELPMNEHTMWQAALKRDRNADGQFVFAVRSTRIYCRPSCPSRRPHRENVVFFAQPSEAEREGFRPCRRCHPNSDVIPNPNTELMQRIARHIETHLHAPLTLDALSEQFHLSPNHLQKTFKRIIGVTPKQYAEACRLNQVKAELKTSDNVTESLYAAGYGSSSRLYEKTDAHLGMTPRAYQRGGVGVRISYTIVACALGRLLVAATVKGICFISLGDSDAQLIGALRRDYPAAEIHSQIDGLGEWVNAIVCHLNGKQPHLDLPLDVQGTAFQKQVWNALRAIPYGQTRSYGELAAQLGKPKASRAVGRACATNPTALVVPCHRAIASNGKLTGYRWGVERKRKLLEMERGVERGA